MQAPEPDADLSELGQLDASLADLDQDQSDADQAASDADQTAAESDALAASIDQEQSDRDQAASDRDQLTADHERDLVHLAGLAASGYDDTRDERLSATRTRLAATVARDETALARMHQATRRDEVAQLRDIAAQRRDLGADARDRAAVRRAARIVAGDRTQRALFEAAAAVREQGAADRAAAAADRARAAHDRRLAAADRRNLSMDLQRAHFDELTGAYVRGLGLHALQHEIERALRTSAPFALCFVDVDGLKAVNDREGHATGDELLRAVGGAIRSALRSYDVTARVGGDEFLCGFAGTTLAAARERFDEVESALAAVYPAASISVGFAALQPGDGVESLMARADADLYRAKRLDDAAG